jgi:hypothetical protein
MTYNEGSTDDNYFEIKFTEDSPELGYNIKSDIVSEFQIGSLRLAMSRISKDSLNCIVAISIDGYISVKVTQDNKNVLIESIVQCL